jgi:RHS repeat-associated protein
VTTFDYPSPNPGRKETTKINGAGSDRTATEYYRDGQLKSVTGLDVIAQHYNYSASVSYQTKTIERKVSSTGPAKTERVVDGLGRTVSLSRPVSVSGGSTTYFTETMTYENSGKILSRTLPKPGGGSIYQVYSYSADGRTVEVGLNAGGGTFDSNSDHLVSRTTESYDNTGSTYWWREVKREGLNDSNAYTTVSKSRVALGPFGGASSGFYEVARSENTEAGKTITSYTEIDRVGQQTKTSTESTASSLTAVSWSVNGRLAASKTLTVADYTKHLLDAANRPAGVTDPRLSKSTAKTYYPTTGALKTVKGLDAPAAEATYVYNTGNDALAGSVKTIENEAGDFRRFDYNERGQLTHQWGQATYPVKYEYDSYGRLEKMHTYRAGTGWDGASWPSGPIDADTTTWSYDAGSGLLLHKEYESDSLNSSDKKVSYTYLAGGPLGTRTWQRGAVTTYAYTDYGQLKTVAYSSEPSGVDTPDVGYEYYRNGRVKFRADAAGKHTLTYRTNGALDSDSIASGGTVAGITAGSTLAGVATDPQFDANNRQTGFDATLNTTTDLAEVDYYYSSYGRPSKVSAGGRSVHYGYASKSDLPDTREYWTGAGATGDDLVVTASYAYDSRNRLTSLNFEQGTTVLVGHAYTLNNLNQRTEATREDGAEWRYGYNDRGEVTSGKKYTTATGSTPLAGWQSEYDFDNIGNRDTAKSGGDSAGANLRTIDYDTVDARNLYTDIDNPTTFDVVGKAPTGTTVTVTVGGSAATVTRQGEYFRAEGTRSGDYTSVTVREDGTTVDAASGKVYTPPAAQDPNYDHDGNLTDDGRWAYTWDGENRLIEMECDPDGSVDGIRLEFAYDAIGRRIEKKVSTKPTSGSWTLDSGEKFVYDGWNCVSKIRLDNLSGTWTPTPEQEYVWGPDLIGTLQGAGGVGGLVLIYDRDGADDASYFPCYDGNGNVMALVDANASGTVDATYEYDAFGKQVRNSGDAASACPFRFSTKYTDSESGLNYYGYRYYSSQMGRWISRDPLGELGGVNLFAFLGNSVTSFWDYLGLDPNSESPPNTAPTKDAKPILLPIKSSRQIIYKGKRIGDLIITEYKPVRNPQAQGRSTLGVKIIVQTQLTDKDIASVCFLRWRQRMSIRDQNGKALDWRGTKADNILDPHPNSDEKEWYYDNKDRKDNTHDQITEHLGDEAKLYYNRINGGTTKVSHTFVSELVKVKDLDQRDGGGSAGND